MNSAVKSHRLILAGSIKAVAQWIHSLTGMERETTAAKLRAIRQSHAAKVLQLTRVAATAIQEIKRVEATMAAEAAAVTQCAAPGRSFEAIYRDYCEDDEACVFAALVKDAAGARALK